MIRFGWSFLFCCVQFSFVGAAYDYQYYKPGYQSARPVSTEAPAEGSQSDRARAAKEVIRNKQVILDNVRAVILSPEAVPDYIRKTAKGVELYRVLQDLSSSKRNQLKRLVGAMLLNKTLTFELLDEVRVAITKFYVNNGQALVVITIPVQDVSDGVVTIQITEARLGEISVVGNHWFSTETYLDYFRLEPDQVIKSSVVEDDVSFVNLNPWRKVGVVYKPGEKPGTTDIELAVQDEKPFRFYLGGDNTGFKVTDENRIFIGFNWGNVFDLDQIMAFEYRASPDFSKYQSVMATYTAPLPWRDLWILYGGYSRISVNSTLIPNNIHTGNSWQLSTRYDMPLTPRGTWRQDAKAGIDYKGTNNDLTVGETVVSTLVATIFEFAGSYDTSFTWGEHFLEAGAEGFLQPWSIGNSMSTSTYAALRPNANPYFFYMRVNGTYIWTDSKNDLRFKTRVRAQVSSACLLPTEQFGIGGANSVRGYLERVVNADQALVINFDFFSPGVSLGQKMFKMKGSPDRLRGIAFLDLGWGGLTDQLSTQDPGYFLAGIGPGLRYEIKHWLQVRFDLGFRLLANPVNAGAAPGSFTQPYFSVIGSY